MTEQSPKSRPSKRANPTSGKPQEVQRREDRLKAALKANIARRKAQAQARADDSGSAENPKD
jgi:hypothetical protein